MTTRASATRQVEWWTRYDASGASTRYRVLQYLDELHAAGWSSRVRPLAPFTSAGHRGRAIGVLRRHADVLTGGPSRARADVRVIQKELLVPAVGPSARMVARFVDRFDGPVVWDIDDAIWHRDRSRLSQSSVLATSVDCVVAGNVVLADWVSTHGARRVEIVPTCAPRPVTPSTGVGREDEVRIGWLGSSTTSRYLEEIAEPLERVLAAFPGARFLTMGGDAPVALRSHPRVTSLPWSERAADELLGSLAIGVAPTPREPYADGKSGFKVVQYLLHGLPVVASDSPVHRDWCAMAGLTATGPADWFEKLSNLVSSVELRRSWSERAYEAGGRRFALEVGAARWAEILASVTMPSEGAG